MSENLPDVLIETNESEEAEFELGRTSEAALEYAKQHELDVVLPSPYCLQLDIDSAADYEIYKKRYNFLDKLLGIDNVFETPSRSGKGWRKHVIITLKTTVTPERRILLQSLMGSDRMREMFSFARVLENDPNPTLLFKKKA